MIHFVAVAFTSGVFIVEIILTGPECELFGDIINSAHRPWVASENSPYRKSRAADGAESPDSSERIAAAGGIILAAGLA